MMNHPKGNRPMPASRSALLACGAIAAIAAGTTAASAQDAIEDAGIREIIVTAQKREQSLQDVPIAITALDATALQANRVTSVLDIGSLAPNLTVLTTPGGHFTPSFGLRGVSSMGSNPGQDKSLGIYIDGVPIGSTYGVGIDLPDLERIEVLRGPQGTLFGRNSTAGAISVISRDPGGEFGLRQQVSVGNYNMIRSSTRVELPTVGPLSAYISYTHDERDGDIRNLGAGTAWDYSAAGLGILRSPKRLGGHNSENVFAAVKFEPSDTFQLVYKFNWVENVSTPEGFGLVAFAPPNIPTFAGIIAAFQASPTPIAGVHRPKAVNNSYTVPAFSKAQSHTVTAALEISDAISLKNIFGYRKTFLRTGVQIDGLGGYTINGGTYVFVATNGSNNAEQYSDELQINYDSDFLTLTVGGIYFNDDQYQGPVGRLPRSPFNTSYPGNVLPSVFPTNFFYKAESLAGYAQAEFHLTPQIDVVGGFRMTNDKKTAVSNVGTATTNTAYPSSYNDTRPTYLVGVNYKPNSDLLVYAKYSTGFVSGGSTYGIEFRPETVKSLEGGVKASLLDRRLQFNLALFHAKYRNLQNTSNGRNIGRAELGSVIITAGDQTTTGVELETTFVPTRGLTLSGSAGYSDYKSKNINYALLCPASTPCQTYGLPYRAKATAQISAQYETEPLFADATLMVRADGNWRSKLRVLSRLPLAAPLQQAEFSRSGWTANGRIALRDIALGSGKVELAVWGKNLFDNDRIGFALDTSGVLSTPYESARTYGLDLTFQY